MSHIQLQHDLERDLNDSFDFYHLSKCLSLGSLDPAYGAAVHLSRNLFKKQVSATSKDSRTKAIEKFRAANEKCRSIPLLDRKTLPGPEHCGARELIYKLTCTTRLGPDLGNLRWDINPTDGSFGPGVSLGAPTESQVDKYWRSIQTGTHPLLYNFYRSALWNTPMRPVFELQDARYGFQKVIGSKLTTVPKSTDIDRVICIEPSLNLFKQKAIEAFLRRRLISIGIDLATQQEKNRLLAKLGSSTGEYATIDLSSASDTISLSLCKWLLPEALLSELMSCRSPFTTVDGEDIELHMISSMGNATTFPLETLIFAACVKSVYRFFGDKAKFSGTTINAAVFGDDIIIKTEYVSKLIEVLTDFGFMVNESKSFWSGKFRESCGGDYLAGRDITPIYSKDSLDSRPALYSLINRLICWSARTGILLPRTIKNLINRIPKKKRLYVPTYMQVDSGIWTEFTRPITFSYLKPVQRLDYFETLDPIENLFIGGYCAQPSVRHRYSYSRRSFRVYHILGRAQAHHPRMVKRALPALDVQLEPAVDLLPVDRHRWSRYLDYYDIPSQ